MSPTFHASLAAEPLDVWGNDFPRFCAELRLFPPHVNAAEVATDEAAAARFILGVLRGSKLLRWRFPDALSSGVDGGFCRWLLRNGARKFSLDPSALKKIRGAFRRQFANRVMQIYLRDFQLQRHFPLGFLPIGQRAFAGWLATFGRSDQDLRDEEILWFLYQSTEHLDRGLALTFLVQPGWQAEFAHIPDRLLWPTLVDSFRRLQPELMRRLYRAQIPSLLRHERVATPSDFGANIFSHFCYPSGLQQAGLWIKRSLEARGVATSARDVPVGVKTQLLDREPWLGLEHHPVSIFNIAPTPYFADAYARAGLWRRDGVYRVGCWAWELELIPDEWLEIAPLIDEIWAPSAFVARAMRSRMRVPVYEMLPGVEVGECERVLKADLRVPDDHYVFLFMFDMYSEFERKNPLAVIDAFRLAFAPNEKASLVIKVSRGSADQTNLARLHDSAERSGVIVIDKVVSREKAYGFLAMCDCFVSLHRSEGFGLALAEAMLLGKPVIGTAYSGNIDYMNPANSALVDYRLVEIAVSGPIYQKGAAWADPSTAHAAELMREVFENREAAAAKGAVAKAELTEKLSLRAAGERMLTRLRAIAGRTA